jgi:hypothetical protein
MYEVRKINKRLVVVDSTGAVAYSMPSWIRVTDRSEMQQLADRFNELGTNDIGAIMEFESQRHKVRSR